MKVEELQLMLTLIEQVRKVADSQSETYYQVGQAALKAGLGGYAAGFQQTEACMTLIDSALSKVSYMLERSIEEEKETVELNHKLVEMFETAINIRCEKER